ncbi:hypothetical protein A6A28_16785 [Streptomyces sp. CB03578]|nr:hypothetical protein A6A28_16785 [Streptomyces sp. CB03578]
MASGLGCEFGFAEPEVAGCLVGEEDTLGLLARGRQERLALGDEVECAGRVSEVQERLAGVDGEVCFYVGASLCLIDPAVTPS